MGRSGLGRLSLQVYFDALLFGLFPLQFVFLDTLEEIFSALGVFDVLNSHIDSVKVKRERTFLILHWCKKKTTQHNLKKFVWWNNGVFTIYAAINYLPPHTNRMSGARKSLQCVTAQMVTQLNSVIHQERSLGGILFPPQREGCTLHCSIVFNTSS